MRTTATKMPRKMMMMTAMKMTKRTKKMIMTVMKMTKKTKKMMMTAMTPLLLAPPALSPS